jgi:hypothetical protein
MFQSMVTATTSTASMKVRPMPKESAPLIKRSVTEKGYFAYANVAFVADQIRESRHETA